MPPKPREGKMLKQSCTITENSLQVPRLIPEKGKENTKVLQCQTIYALEELHVKAFAKHNIRHGLKHSVLTCRHLGSCRAWPQQPRRMQTSRLPSRAQRPGQQSCQLVRRITLPAAAGPHVPAAALLPAAALEGNVGKPPPPASPSRETFPGKKAAPGCGAGSLNGGANVLRGKLRDDLGAGRRGQRCAADSPEMFRSR